MDGIHSGVRLHGSLIVRLFVLVAAALAARATRTLAPPFQTPPYHDDGHDCKDGDGEIDSLEPEHGVLDVVFTLFLEHDAIHI